MALVPKYGEPWKVTRGGLSRPRPEVDGLDPEVSRELISAWEEQQARSPHLIWASRMVDPTFATSYLTGHPIFLDDRRVLLSVPPLAGLPEDFPSAERVAERIVHVVNACAGIGDVEHFVIRARQLMTAAIPW